MQEHESCHIQNMAAVTTAIAAATKSARCEIRENFFTKRRSDNYDLYIYMYKYVQCPHCLRIQWKLSSEKKRDMMCGHAQVTTVNSIIIVYHAIKNSSDWHLKV
eukprot:scpid35833/ scgid34724/ 